jgi:hypothetical protein
MKVVDLTQVLLFREAEMSKLVGPVLWRVFEEIRTFFKAEEGEEKPGIGIPSVNVKYWRSGSAMEWLEPSDSFMRLRPTLLRYYLASEVPIDVDMHTDDTLTKRLDELWHTVPEKFGTYDHRILGQAVREIVDTDGTILVVTDQEITPPKNWRYIIWDILPGGAVMSIASTDPVYWGDREVTDSERLKSIKRRVRATCITITAVLLGISRCDNPRCYLKSDIDSVLQIDEMMYFGPEHGVPELANRGFSGTADPGRVEEVQEFG